MTSKIIYVIIGMVILNISLLIFTCPNVDVSTGQCIGSESVGTISSNTSSIFSFIWDPTVTDDSSIWERLFGSAWGLLAGIAFIGIIATVAYTRTHDFIYLAIGLFMATTVYPAIKLWQLVNASSFADELTRQVIAVIVVGTIILTVLFTVIDWARGRE